MADNGQTITGLPSRPQEPLRLRTFPTAGSDFQGAAHQRRAEHRAAPFQRSPNRRAQLPRSPRPFATSPGALPLQTRTYS